MVTLKATINSLQGIIICNLVSQARDVSIAISTVYYSLAIYKILDFKRHPH